GNTQPSRKPHDADGAVAFALLSGRFVFCRIPCISDAKSFDASWNTVIVTLAGSDHAIFPILGNYRNPVPGDVSRSGRFCCRRSLRAALTSLTGGAGC